VSGKANRYEANQTATEARARDAMPERLRVLPRPVPLPKGLRDVLPQYGACGTSTDEACTLVYRAGASEAVAVPHACLQRLAAETLPGVRDDLLRGPDCEVGVLKANGATWRVVMDRERPGRTSAQVGAILAGLKAGALEVRSVERRQLFIGGEPVGIAFD
jgi:hypothetical protein